MTKPRQLAPTVGPAHGGVEFLEGSFSGIERFMINPDDHGQSPQIYCWEIRIMVKLLEPADTRSIELLGFVCGASRVARRPVESEHISLCSLQMRPDKNLIRCHQVIRLTHWF